MESDSTGHPASSPGFPEKAGTCEQAHAHMHTQNKTMKVVKQMKQNQKGLFGNRGRSEKDKRGGEK